LAARIAQGLEDRARAQGVTNIAQITGTGTADWL
jgi:hypothetical protein